MATLKSMFKFPEGSEVHLQCDVAQCPGGCSAEVCPGDVLTASAIKGDSNRPKSPEDGTMLAATTVFVLDPADAPRTFAFEFQIAQHSFDCFSVSSRIQLFRQFAKTAVYAHLGCSGFVLRLASSF